MVEETELGNAGHIGVRCRHSHKPSFVCDSRPSAPSWHCCSKLALPATFPGAVPLCCHSSGLHVQMAWTLSLTELVCFRGLRQEGEPSMLGGRPEEAGDRAVLRCCDAYLDRTVVINGHIFGGSKQQMFMLPRSENKRSGIMGFGAIHSPGSFGVGSFYFTQL